MSGEKDELIRNLELSRKFVSSWEISVFNIPKTAGLLSGDREIIQRRPRNTKMYPSEYSRVHAFPTKKSRCSANMGKGTDDSKLLELSVLVLFLLWLGTGMKVEDTEVAFENWMGVTTLLDKMDRTSGYINVRLSPFDENFTLSPKMFQRGFGGFWGAIGCGATGVHHGPCTPFEIKSDLTNLIKSLMGWSYFLRHSQPRRSKSKRKKR